MNNNDENDEWNEEWELDEDDDMEFEKEMNQIKPPKREKKKPSPLINYKKQKLIELLVSGYIVKHSKNNVFFPNAIILFTVKYLQNLVNYTIDSQILCEFDKWILIELLFRPKNTVLKTNNKYRLKLLYNAERDGWNAANYHNKCDHYSPTITIIHSNYDHIFGGFTKIPLSNKHKLYCDENAFLFLIRSHPSKNDKPQIFEISKQNEREAIKYHNQFGPIFGEGPDIIIDTNNKNGKCYSKSYRYPRNNMLCGDASINEKLQWVAWNENDFDINDPDLYDQGFHTDNNIVKHFNVTNYEVFQLLLD